MGGPINKNLNPLGPATKFLKSSVFSRVDPLAAGAMAPFAEAGRQMGTTGTVGDPKKVASYIKQPVKATNPAKANSPADVTYGSSPRPKKRRKTGTVMTSAQGVMGNAPVDRKSLLGS